MEGTAWDSQERGEEMMGRGGAGHTWTGVGMVGGVLLARITSTMEQGPISSVSCGKEKVSDTHCNAPRRLRQQPHERERKLAIGLVGGGGEGAGKINNS